MKSDEEIQHKINDLEDEKNLLFAKGDMLGERKIEEQICLLEWVRA